MVKAVLADLRRRLDSEVELAATTWRLLCAFVVAIPLSIALAQILLTLTTAVAIVHLWRTGRRPPRTPLDAPILGFVAAAILAAFLGLDVRQGLWGARTYLQIVILYLVLGHVDGPARALTLVRFFLAGMIVTSTHTVANTILGGALPNPFPGSMTESGQLLFAIGLTASLRLHRQLWPTALPWVIALHVAALVVNLKRGVWLGVLAMSAVLGLLRSRRLILVAAAVVVVTVAAVPPVQQRLTHTVRDLYLPGNRYDIWCATIDVIERFPMGIGRKNGTILRDYPNIPAKHKHAHNNLLQITMEFGILGLAAFAWWMTAFGVLAWRAWRRAPRDGPASALALGVFASFVGFHVAGLVEYNFGDTEVLEIVFLTMGLGLVVARSQGDTRVGGPVTAPATVVPNAEPPPAPDATRGTDRRE